MRPVHFTPEQQTAPALRPVRLQRAQVQQHQRPTALAVGRRAAEGGLEEVSQLSQDNKITVSNKIRDSRIIKNENLTFEFR